MARAIADVPLPHVAAIYRRVSSLKQSAEDKYALDTQLDAAQAWCAAQGWATSEQHIYTDVWTGEDLWQRPGLMRLLEGVDAGRVGLVLAHAVDRLTREQTGGHLAIIAERIERAGARLECVTEPLDATPQGVMMRNFRAFAAGSVSAAIAPTRASYSPPPSHSMAIGLTPRTLTARAICLKSATLRTR